jgi:hypothetical protein
MALHSSFFFFGQAIGPVVYRIGLAQVGLTTTLVVGGLVIIGVGFVCSIYLRRRAISGRGT